MRLDVAQAEYSAYPALPPPIPVPLLSCAPHDCPYLPGRTAVTRALRVGRLPGQLYHQFLDAGFRRSGDVIYQPVCPGCRACVPLRVPVAEFRPSKSQRRCARTNADLRISVAPPVPSDEKFELYRRYKAARHGGEADDRADFEGFLYHSPVDSLEFAYRDAAGRLLAVGICDISAVSLSSVYFYFDPKHARRGLGTFGALQEINFASRGGVAHYYLGYWINECRSMRYKAAFRPCELLGGDGRWRLMPTTQENTLDADDSADVNSR